jgi:hypothetical protein
MSDRDRTECVTLQRRRRGMTFRHVARLLWLKALSVTGRIITGQTVLRA